MKRLASAVVLCILLHAAASLAEDETPCAMSLDCACRCTSTDAFSQWKPACS